MGFYIAFNNIGHIVTKQKPGTGKKIPTLQGYFQKGLSVAEGTYTALYNAAHVYSDQANLHG